MNIFRPFGSLGKERVGWWRQNTNLKILFFVNNKNTGKMTRAQGKHRENRGNLVLIEAWQPWKRKNETRISSPLKTI